MTAPVTASCEIRPQGGLEVLAWPAFEGLGAQVMVTTRGGGVSAGPYESLNLSFSVDDEPGAVLENRRRTAAAASAGLADFVFARQVHSSRARVVTAADRGRGTLSLDDAVPDTDALVTADPGVVLAILVGDCVPVVLYDPAARVLACVHAGWRGTVAGIGPATLTAMAGLGARPERVLAGIGPAIGPDRYQVGGDVATEVRRYFGPAAEAGEGGGDHDAGGGTGPGTGTILRPDGTGRWLLDLWAANRRQLAQAGVPDGQIHVAAVPTGPDPGGQGHGLFFSDRTARPCGRFALVARLTHTDQRPTPGEETRG
jgi:YfiH family protein